MWLDGGSSGCVCWMLSVSPGSLEVPKAVSAKCVGLKRDTEEVVLFFFSSRILLYCKWRRFWKNMTLSTTVVSLNNNNNSQKRVHKMKVSENGKR